MKKNMLYMTGMLTAAALVLAGCSNNKEEADQTNPPNQTEEAAVPEDEAAQGGTADNQAAAEGAQAEEKNYLYLEDIKPEDYITLGEYKGISIDKPKPEITDEEQQSYIDYLLRMDPPAGAVNGDTVNIDYVGKLDGTAFEGGSAQGTDLVLGSNSFIEGFEAGLVGAKVGETKDLNLSFPEGYQEPTMAGKDVVFTVTVNHILAVTPQELTEEFVKGQNLDLNTVEEFRQYAYDQLYEQKAAAIDADMERIIVTTIVEKCEVKQELPEELLNRYIDNMLNNLTMQAQAYGITLQEYMLAATGLDEAGYMEEMKKESRTAAEQYVIMQAISNKEGMNLSEEEFLQEIEKQAAASGYEDVNAYREVIDEKGFKEYLMSQRVVAMLMENTTIVE